MLPQSVHPPNKAQKHELQIEPSQAFIGDVWVGVVLGGLCDTRQSSLLQNCIG